MGYVFLGLAIIAEIIGTTTLKATEQFTKLMPSVIVVISYCASFYLLSVAIKSIQVGTAYAIWCGVGIVFVTALSAIIYKQMPDTPAVIGMLLIVAGVIIINAFSQTTGH